ncbi:MAG: hypothetical protein WAX89_03170 [Alphaproteobacteria bacterium]
MREVIFLSLLFLTGCAAFEPVKINTPFDAVATKKLLIEGKNIVKGNAFISQRNGGLVTCAGKSVSLTPATGYAKERMIAIYGSEDVGYSSAFSGKKPKFEPDVPEYSSLSKETLCNVRGEFMFDKVADGEFYITVGVLWRVDAYFDEGGYLMKKVSVSDGETKDITLAP